MEFTLVESSSTHVMITFNDKSSAVFVVVFGDSLLATHSNFFY